MATTKVTVTVELEHSADVDLPARVAARLEEALAEAPEIAGVSVVCAEMGELVWIPHGARLAIDQLLDSERRIAEAQRRRAEAAEAARAGAEAARADAEAARSRAEQRADDAAADLKNLRARVWAAEEARSAAESKLAQASDGGVSGRPESRGQRN